MEGKNSIKTIKKLDEAYRTSRIINLVVILAFFIFVTVIVVVYKEVVIKGIDRVYLVKDHSLYRVTDEQSMVKGHITNFMKLFFEIDQFNFKENTNKSLYLIGQDGLTLNKSLTASRFYSQMVATNMRCSIDIDSIVFRSNVAPYNIDVYARWKKRNEYNQKENNLWCSMQVVKTSNSEKNPFGYVIESFKIKNQDDITKKEN